MSNLQIVINLTEQQAEKLKTLHSPYINCDDIVAGKDQTASINVLEVIDDMEVNSYTLNPDGTYTKEQLNDFGQGWSLYAEEDGVEAQ
ncbi:hypothetical protein [Corynebacterium crudilactis]|uniref:Uncharacterized protein n=1 Tax=Corynebacterium crudilactis TaxID=1652495 RepID=A0A172QXZ2_9CORY|nr:hypothetical protein [Corynebacterium crudilactis]ANE05511.1 hypothetical protein ccrud_14315 [Corynebacterium crudilactis]